MYERFYESGPRCVSPEVNGDAEQISFHVEANSPENISCTEEDKVERSPRVFFFYNALQT